MAASRHGIEQDGKRMNVTNELQGGTGLDLRSLGRIVYQNSIQMLSISGALASTSVSFLNNHLIY